MVQRMRLVVHMEALEYTSLVDNHYTKFDFYLKVGKLCVAPLSFHKFNRPLCFIATLFVAFCSGKNCVISIGCAKSSSEIILSFEADERIC